MHVFSIPGIDEARIEGLYNVKKVLRSHERWTSWRWALHQIDVELTGRFRPMSGITASMARANQRAYDHRCQRCREAVDLTDPHINPVEHVDTILLMMAYAIESECWGEVADALEGSNDVSHAYDARMDGLYKSPD